MQTEDPRLVEAKAIPIMETAERLGVTAELKRTGSEHAGPCPQCGGTDRFAISPAQNIYNCRTCGGGDGIALVQMVLSLDFKAALSWLVGERDDEVSAEEVERRRRNAEESARKREETQERKRREALMAAQRIWKEALPAVGTAVEDYLAARGFPPHALAMPSTLRSHPALPYMIHQEGAWIEIHRGPAMIAVVQAPDGKLSAIHRTWIDPDRPGKKAQIVHAGESQAAKKTLGSVKGGAIRLTSHPCRADGFSTLIMGEGIETTLSAVIADAVPGAAYWSGVSLPNMSGRRITRGEGMLYAGVPDLHDDEAFVPPPWVKRLVFIQDGDSEPRKTRAQLLAGLRRAMHRTPDLTAQIVHAGEGVDLNDVLRGDDA
ncbi:CHC2 zinc finger domain-containing protein [Palleronia sp.]|uniref:DUF7146 domain-containing protein n=1 Tax=Palleronia sp. TaxID=1940284 RepID=UPI0035C8637E